MANQLALSRLLQLASPLLPVGAYSYSQGLEWAIECADVHDARSAQYWITDVLTIYQAQFELPVLLRLYQAWHRNDMAQVDIWNRFYLASRDTAEAMAETQQMGYSMRRLLTDLHSFPDDLMQPINGLETPVFLTILAAIGQHWAIEAEDLLQAYGWSWCENQVSVAMKTVPLGQVAGQKILLALGQLLPEVVESALLCPDDAMSNFNPLLTISGCRHETQYSRLFRS